MEEYVYNGKLANVVLTKHGYDMALKRGMNNHAIDTFIKEVIENHKENRYLYEGAPYNTEYFMYSRHLQRGMVLAYRRDFKNKADTRNHFIIVTVYPYGKALPMKGDTDIIYI